MIQEYDVTLVNIAGTRNHFADMSRHQAGLKSEQVNALKRPQEIIIARIDLGQDISIRKDIRKLAGIGEKDPDLKEIRKLAEEGREDVKERFLLHENLLYAADMRNGPRWKVVIPRGLEE
jgi:hypothetical protein